jgi:hypothetical protein
MASFDNSKNNETNRGLQEARISSLPSTSRTDAYFTQVVISRLPLTLYNTRSRQIWHVEGAASPPVINLTPAEQSAQLAQLRTCGPKRSSEQEEMVRGLQNLRDSGGETIIIERDSEKGREMAGYFGEKRRSDGTTRSGQDDLDDDVYRPGYDYITQSPNTQTCRFTSWLSRFQMPDFVSTKVAIFNYNRIPRNG